jgi:hypothetical protein
MIDVDKIADTMYYYGSDENEKKEIYNNRMEFINRFNIIKCKGNQCHIPNYIKMDTLYNHYLDTYIYNKKKLIGRDKFDQDHIICYETPTTYIITFSNYGDYGWRADAEKNGFLDFGKSIYNKGADTMYKEVLKKKYR